MINFAISLGCTLLLVLSSTLMVSSSAHQLRPADTEFTKHADMIGSIHDLCLSEEPAKHEHAHTHDCPFCRELDVFILNDTPQIITANDTHFEKVKFWHGQASLKTYSTHKYAARAPPVVHI